MWVEIFLSFYHECFYFAGRKTGGVNLRRSMYVLSELSFPGLSASSRSLFLGKSALTATFSSSPCTSALKPAGRRPAAQPGPPHLLSYLLFYVLLTRLYSISICVCFYLTLSKCSFKSQLYCMFRGQFMSQFTPCRIEMVDFAMM